MRRHVHTTIGLVLGLLLAWLMLAGVLAVRRWSDYWP